MKFKVYQTSSWGWDDEEEYKDFETLEELVNFCKEVKYPVIINAYRDALSLEIYDDYRE